MTQPCTSCFEPHETGISRHTGRRAEVLGRFIALQREGYAPAMCEGTGGRHTVCHNDARRPLASLRRPDCHLDPAAF